MCLAAWRNALMGISCNIATRPEAKHLCFWTSPECGWWRRYGSRRRVPRSRPLIAASTRAREVVQRLADELIDLRPTSHVVAE